MQFRDHSEPARNTRAAFGLTLGFAAAFILAAAGAADAAPSQKSLRKAFTPRLAGTWGDVRPDGSVPKLPDSWNMFTCGDNPALVIAGNDKSGFTVKYQSMETGPLDGALVVGNMDSKTSGRVVLPNAAWEQRVSFQNADRMIIDSVENPEGAPSRDARFLQRCR